MAEHGTVKTSTESSVKVASFDPQEDKKYGYFKRENLLNPSGKQQELQSVSVSESLKSAEPFGTASELEMFFLLHMIIGKGEILLGFLFFCFVFSDFVLYLTSRRHLAVVRNSPI